MTMLSTIVSVDHAAE